MRAPSPLDHWPSRFSVLASFLSWTSRGCLDARPRYGCVAVGSSFCNSSKGGSAGKVPGRGVGRVCGGGQEKEGKKGKQAIAYSRA